MAGDLLRLRRVVVTYQIGVPGLLWMASKGHRREQSLLTREGWSGSASKSMRLACVAPMLAADSMAGRFR
jgi:hypothetical protein